MAWLNIWRRSSRSILVMLMIAVSMSAMLALIGLYDGMTKQVIQSTIRSDCGEISIYAPQHRLHKTLEHRIEQSDLLVDQLKQFEAILHVNERIVVQGLASTARKSMMAQLIGIDLKSEERFGGFERFIIEGQADWGRRQMYAIIGKKLAEDLKLKLGSRLIFSTQNVDNEISSISLRIGAIVQTGNMLIDAQGLYIDIKKSEAFLGIENAHTQIALRIDPKTDLKALHVKLENAFPTLENLSWYELYPALEQMQVVTDVFNTISFAIVMLVVLIGIMGVMLVSILERVREFGVLMAIGLQYRQLRIQILFEALILGMIGYLIGALSGWMALLYLNQFGLDLREFSAGLEAFGFSSVIYADIRLYYFILSALAIFIAALLSTVLPLQRIKKMQIIEVIQGE
jgi:putative ABC transport system permease protein